MFEYSRKKMFEVERLAKMASAANQEPFYIPRQVVSSTGPFTGDVNIGPSDINKYMWKDIVDLMLVELMELKIKYKYLISVCVVDMFGTDEVEMFRTKKFLDEERESGDLKPCGPALKKPCKSVPGKVSEGLKKLADPKFDWSADCGDELSYDEWVVFTARKLIKHMEV